MIFLVAGSRLDANRVTSVKSEYCGNAQSRRVKMSKVFARLSERIVETIFPGKFLTAANVIHPSEPITWLMLTQK